MPNSRFLLRAKSSVSGKKRAEGNLCNEAYYTTLTSKKRTSSRQPSSRYPSRVNSGCIKDQVSAYVCNRGLECILWLITPSNALENKISPKPPTSICQIHHPTEYSPSCFFSICLLSNRRKDMSCTWHIWLVRAHQVSSKDDHAILFASRPDLPSQTTQQQKGYFTKDAALCWAISFFKRVSCTHPAVLFSICWDTSWSYHQDTQPSSHQQI